MTQPITWVAYCTVCNEELCKAPNGEFVETVAREHIEETQHRTLIGYYVEDDDDEG